jgi:predicted amidohydrolase YtcJ
MNQNRSADGSGLILTGGGLFSANSPYLEKSTVIIRNGKIADVGTWSNVKIPAKTQRIDAEGCSIVPGFIESHTCFATDSRKIDQIDLQQTPLKLEALTQKLHAAADILEPEEWMVAVNYEEDASQGTVSIRAKDLDLIVQDRPIALFSREMDMGIFNTAALNSLEFVDKLEDDAEVQFERTPDLKPTGRLSGNIAKILPDGFPCHELNSLKRKMIKLAGKFLSMGVTTVHDIDVFRPMDMAAYVSLRQEGKLPIRVVPFIRGYPRDECFLNGYLASGMGTGFGDAWLRLGPMKISIDGFLGKKTAAVSAPWDEQGYQYGQLYISEDRLVETIRKATNSGFQMAFHANGDRAIGLVLDALKKAQDRVSRPLLRPRIHHCTLPRPEQIKQMKRLDAVPVGHPHFIRFLGDSHLEILGEARVQADYFPFRRYMDEGLPGVLSSEPILPLDRIHPMIGISTAITRKTLKGITLGPDHKIDLEEALRMYTLNPAYAAFEEDYKGSVETGKFADMVVLNSNIRKVSPEDLDKVQVKYTILNGKIVYTKDAL